MITSIWSKPETNRTWHWRP